VLRFFIPSLIWTIIVIGLSVFPGKEIPTAPFYFEGIDKVVHFGLYLMLIFFWVAGMKRQNISPSTRNNAFYIAVFGGFLLGLGLETVQHFFIKNRYFEGLDLIANGIGCIFGLFLFKLIYKNSYK
jgi:hypothetical protein